MNSFDLSGRTAMVTGASGGLGMHFAALLASHGAKVVLAARRQSLLAEQVSRIKANGGEAIAAEMDVTSARSVSAAFDLAEQTFGTVSVLINNAGIAKLGKAINIDEASWDLVVDTNLKGVWLTAREAARRMIELGVGGSVVNISSILGLRGSLAKSSYSASKAAVINLTETLALEWMREGIRVNALCPGYIKTDINADYFETAGGKEYIASMPLQRLGKAHELDGPLMLLASEAGSFINGIALPVDGGHLVKGL
jgi:NAD(P)-dependent dehydrogenase (short-subunit alcohol dehydrogenase family)